MATIDQVLALISAKGDGNDDRFCSIVAQIAAGETRAKHGNNGDRLAKALESLKRKTGQAQGLKLLPAGAEKLMRISQPSIKLDSLVLDQRLRSELDSVLDEQRKADLLRAHGLAPAQKLLLTGSPGTGKTMTAAALACELNLPLFQIEHDAVIQSYLGATGASLRLVFTAMQNVPGVYFIDEFDAMGTTRHSDAKDTGEMNRVVSAMLQFLDEGRIQGLFVAASNHAFHMDKALFRRFDAMIEYVLPTTDQALAVMRQRLVQDLSMEMTDPNDDWAVIHALIQEVHPNLSQADLTLAIDRAARKTLLSGRETVSLQSLSEALAEIARKAGFKTKE